jgi:hypothetical protein
MLARVSPRSAENVQYSRIITNDSSLFKHLAQDSILRVFPIIDEAAREGPHSSPDSRVWAAFNHQ